MQELIFFLSDWRMVWIPAAGLVAAWRVLAIIAEMIRETADDFYL
jgi:hypothetical protein